MSPRVPSPSRHQDLLENTPLDVLAGYCSRCCRGRPLVARQTVSPIGTLREMTGIHAGELTLGFFGGGTCN